MIAARLGGQEVGTQAREFMGNGAVIAVKLHAGSAGATPSTAVVRLLHGTVPAAERETSSGVVEFVVNQLGEYTVIVSAGGYLEEQKEVPVEVDGRTQVDIFLRLAMPGVAGAPGKAVLAPKAKEALDQGIRALKENRLADAEKSLGTALRLVPANPDVLYVEGLLRLKQGDWQRAQGALEKVTQLDPSSARGFAALGMALCNAGKYEAAVAPLEKSLQLEATGTWQTYWALGKSYYHQGRFEEALKASQEASAAAHGEAPEIALLVAQSQTAVGNYDEAARGLREFLHEHGDRPEAATAKRWLEQLAANGKIQAVRE
jgi:Flp pilus assembly protein TadD